MVSTRRSRAKNPSDLIFRNKYFSDITVPHNSTAKNPSITISAAPNSLIPPPLSSPFLKQLSEQPWRFLVGRRGRDMPAPLPLPRRRPALLLPAQSPRAAQLALIRRLRGEFPNDEEDDTRPIDAPSMGKKLDEVVERVNSRAAAARRIGVETRAMRAKRERMQLKSGREAYDNFHDEVAKSQREERIWEVEREVWGETVGRREGRIADLSVYHADRIAEFK